MPGARFLVLLLALLFALPAQFARASTTPAAPKICCEHMIANQPCDGCSDAPVGPHVKCCLDSALQLFLSGQVAFVPLRQPQIGSVGTLFRGRPRSDPPLLTPPRVA